MMMYYKNRERMVDLLNIGTELKDISIIMNIDIDTIKYYKAKTSLITCSNDRCKVSFYVLDSRKKYCNKSCMKEHKKGIKNPKGIGYYNAKVEEYFRENY